MSKNDEQDVKVSQRSTINYNIIEIAKSEISKWPELQFYDKGKVCHNTP